MRGRNHAVPDKKISLLSIQEQKSRWYPCQLHKSYGSTIGVLKTSISVNHIDLVTGRDVTFSGNTGNLEADFAFATNDGFTSSNLFLRHGAGTPLNPFTMIASKKY